MKMNLQFNQGVVIPSLEKEIVMGLIRDEMREKLLNEGDEITIKIRVSPNW